MKLSNTTTYPRAYVHISNAFVAISRSWLKLQLGQIGLGPGKWSTIFCSVWLHMTAGNGEPANSYVLLATQ